MQQLLQPMQITYSFLPAIWLEPTAIGKPSGWWDNGYDPGPVSSCLRRANKDAPNENILSREDLHQY
jgi:hypothetical protein